MKIENYKKAFSCLMFIIALLFVKAAYAQDKLSGRILENKTKILLPGITVENLKSHSISISDQDGKFSIKANTGDLIRFSGYPYQPDTLFVQNLRFTEIYLIFKQNNLKEVNVTASEVKTGSLKPPPTVTPFGGQTVRYQTNDKLENKGGVQFALGDYHANVKKKRKEAELSANDVASAQIAEVFNQKNLQKYLPIKGQELDNFIILYIPNIKTYHDNFNLTLYLDSCYKEFLKIPLQDRQSKTYLDLSGKPE